MLLLNDPPARFVLDTTDPKTMTWAEVPTSGRLPPPCYGHNMGIINGKLNTYGGFDELGGQIIKVGRCRLTPG
jgi:hypothetical protein